MSQREEYPLMVESEFGAVAQIAPFGDPDDEDRANARLIASAPDLLAALLSLYEHCSMVHKHWGDGSNQHEADAAIAAGLSAISKAKGE